MTWVAAAAAGMGMGNTAPLTQYAYVADFRRGRGAKKEIFPPVARRRKRKTNTRSFLSLPLFLRPLQKGRKEEGSCDPHIVSAHTWKRRKERWYVEKFPSPASKKPPPPPKKLFSPLTADLSHEPIIMGLGKDPRRIGWRGSTKARLPYPNQKNKSGLLCCRDGGRVVSEVFSRPLPFPSPGQASKFFILLQGSVLLRALLIPPPPCLPVLLAVSSSICVQKDVPYRICIPDGMGINRGRRRRKEGRNPVAGVSLGGHKRGGKRRKC